MYTNIITFKNPYLVNFLNYQFSNGTVLSRYYLNWLKINVTKAPRNYKPRPTTKLKENEVVIDLKSTTHFYLSFIKQNEFETIVLDSFYVVVFSHLFSKHFFQKKTVTIDNILDQYNIDIDYAEIITKRFYRLRNDYKTRR